MSENLLVENVNRVLWITVNRPEKLNALSSKVIAEIGAAVDAAEKDPAVGAIAIIGAGEKAFVAGADIVELNTLDAEGGKRFSEAGQRVFDRIESCGKVVIAAINGFCLGGGCELAMACHLRIAVPGAKFGQPEVNLGLIPGAGGTQRLTRLVGKGRALELILSAATIDAAEAWRIGLVNQIAAPADGQTPVAALRAAVEALATTIASKGPVAVRYAIEAVGAGAEQPQADGLRLEANLFGLCFATEDMKEGTTAFKEKRKAAFKGR
jgi:enoyl-CoA hydratase